MKLVKMLSLAAVAAIAAMAFVGTSSAFAKDSVLLCKNKELECKNPWPSPVGPIIAHSVEPKLLSTIGTVECEKSLAKFTLKQPTLAKLQLGHIEELGFEGNCHLGGTSCVVTVLETGGISITHGANPLEWHGIAVPLPLGETSMNTKANVKCGFLINCTYEGGAETLTTATNGAEGDITLVAKDAELKRTSGFCPEVSKWDATYLSLVGGLWLES